MTSGNWLTDADGNNVVWCGLATFSEAIGHYFTAGLAYRQRSCANTIYDGSQISGQRSGLGRDHRPRVGWPVKRGWLLTEVANGRSALTVSAFSYEQPQVLTRMARRLTYPGRHSGRCSS